MQNFLILKQVVRKRLSFGAKQPKKSALDCLTLTMKTLRSLEKQADVITALKMQHRRKFEYSSTLP